MNTVFNFNELKLKQLEIEEQRNKNKVLPMLTKMFYEDDSIKGFLAEHIQLKPKIFIRTLVNLAIHKRIEVGTFAGLLFKSFKEDLPSILNYFEYLESIGFLVMDDKDRFYCPSLELPSELEENLIKWQYPLPLIIPPKKITNNSTSGYYSLPYEGVVLKRKATDDDIYLNHINRLNSVAYRLNVHVINNVVNKWEGKKKKKHKSEYDFYVAEFTTQKNFERYMKFAIDHITYLYGLDTDFYFSWRYDKRGRVYSQGYYLNPQGNDWNKYTLQLAKAELVRK